MTKKQLGAIKKYYDSRGLNKECVLRLHEVLTEGRWVVDDLWEDGVVGVDYLYHWIDRSPVSWLSLKGHLGILIGILRYD